MKHGYYCVTGFRENIIFVYITFGPPFFFQKS